MRKILLAVMAISLMVVPFVGCENGELPPIPEGYQTPEGVVITVNTITPTPTPVINTPEPTETPRVEATATPTDTPMPTDTPIPTATPVPILCPVDSNNYVWALWENLGELAIASGSLAQGRNIENHLAEADSLYIAAMTIVPPYELAQAHSLYLEAIANYAEYAGQRLAGQYACDYIKQAQEKMEQFEDTMWEINKSCDFLPEDYLVSSGEGSIVLKSFIRYNHVSGNFETLGYRCK